MKIPFLRLFLRDHPSWCCLRDPPARCSHISYSVVIPASSGVRPEDEEDIPEISLALGTSRAGRRTVVLLSVTDSDRAEIEVELRLNEVDDLIAHLAALRDRAAE